jgi:hypothetical protein
MAHPQNSPRGLHSKWRYSVPVSCGVMLEDYSTTSDLLTGAASGLKVAGGLALSTQTDYITQSASAVVLPTGLSISAAAGVITQNSTSVTFPGAVKVSNQSNGTVTGSSSGLIVTGGLALSAQTSYMTQSGTTVTFPGAIVPGGSKSFSSNSTGYVFGAVNSAPTTRSSAKVAQLLSSSKNYLMINSTGTTWLYLNVTSVAPY